MLRVCGATEEAKPLDQRRCSCGGVFCGKGGARLSQQFRRAFRTNKTAASKAQYLELVAQADLFDGDRERQVWIDRLARVVPFSRKQAS